MNNFKQELFLGLFSEHYGEKGVSLDDLVNKTMLADAKLNQDEIKLEDLRDGKFGGIELSEAIEKLAFELQNDRDLYSAYREKLAYVIYNVFNEDDFVEIQAKEKLAELAQESAESFLDAYINDALRNKESNEEYKRENMPNELNVE